MSQYFSRLAERSGVATSTHALQSRPARSGETGEWSEQNTEIIAQPGPSRTDSNVAYHNPKEQSASIHKDNFSINAAAEMPETHRRVSANSAATSEPSNIAPSAMISEIHSSLNTTQSQSRSSSLADEMPVTSNTVASSAYATKNDIGERITIAAKPSKIIATENLASAIHRQSESMRPDKALVSSAPNTSSVDTANIIKTRSMNSDTSSAEWPESNKTLPSSRENHKVQSTARIASQPVQTITDSEITPRSSSRSSVQVSIGKIELEIHAPAKPLARTPQPAKMSAAPTKTTTRNAAFNPHRHYLRSR
jgi:hypothetical protein